MHTPLDDFMWFDVATVKFPYSFELVVCDGPALYGHPEPYQSAWRVGLLSVLRDHGVRADEILLDDAEDLVRCGHGGSGGTTSARRSRRRHRELSRCTRGWARW